MKKFFVMLVAFVMCTIVLGILPLQAQNSVHLLQSFQYDASIANTFYGEAGLLYVNFADADVTETIIAARGGIPINDKMEVVAQWAYVNITPDNFDALNGLADIGLFGRYNFYNNGITYISAGPFLTLPIGEEDVGQGNLNFGGFCALRHILRSGLVITGNIGLEFYETWEWEGDKMEEKYTNQILLGAGAIFPVSGDTHIIGEFYMKGDMDYSVLSGAVDHKLGPGRIRAGIGIGLDDGAPDLMIAGGYAMTM